MKPLITLLLEIIIWDWTRQPNQLNKLQFTHSYTHNSSIKNTWPHYHKPNQWIYKKKEQFKLPTIIDLPLFMISLFQVLLLLGKKYNILKSFSFDFEVMRNVSKTKPKKTKLEWSKLDPIWLHLQQQWIILLDVSNVIDNDC